MYARESRDSRESRETRILVATVRIATWRLIPNTNAGLMVVSIEIRRLVWQSTYNYTASRKTGGESHGYVPTCRISSVEGVPKARNIMMKKRNEPLYACFDSVS